MKIIKTEDGLHTIYSAKYNETYHSKHGVLQEAQHVFLDGCDIAEKMYSKQEISILEIGFGTGFNFFLTAGLAVHKKAKLFYYAIEKDLLSYDDLIELNHHIQFSDSPVWQDFSIWRKEVIGNLKNGSYSFIHRNIELKLICENALDINFPHMAFDAVYLDPFSPDVNPELWTVSFFRKIKLSMKTGAKLSTYSAKGRVKRALLEAGFMVEKLPGPKGKREMLVASKT